VTTIAAANVGLYLASSQGSLSVLYSYLVVEFGWNRAELGSIGSLILFVAGLLGLFAGIACDRFGPRAVVLTGALTGATGCALAGEAAGLTWLYGFALLIAISKATMGFAPCQVLATRGFDKRRGLAMGIATAGLSLGGILGPLATSGLAELSSWRIAYQLYAGLVLLMTPVVFWQLRTFAGPVNEAAPGRAAIKLRDVFRSRAFWLPTLALAAMLYAVVAIAQFWVLMQTERGMTTRGAAGLLTVYYAMGIAGRFVFGPLYDRFSPRRVGTIQALVMCGLVLLLLLPDSAWAAATYAILFGACYGGFLFLSSLMLGDRFADSGRLGTIIGAMASVAAILYSTAPAVAGWLYDVTGTYSAPIVLAGSTALLAALFVWTSGHD
jgi:MFS family permease